MFIEVVLKNGFCSVHYVADINEAVNIALMISNLLDIKNHYTDLTNVELN